jgi:hypothetical protein
MVPVIGQLVTRVLARNFLRHVVKKITRQMAWLGILTVTFWIL